MEILSLGALTRSPIPHEITANTNQPTRKLNTTLTVVNQRPRMVFSEGSKCKTSQGDTTNIRASTIVDFVCNPGIFGPGQPKLVAQLPPGDEEEAWYNATRLLGQLYLEELNRPDLALKAYSDYKNYHKSGADTLYHIGRCYEALNDAANAIRFYGAVTAFEEHPRYRDAKEALARLGKRD